MRKCKLKNSRPKALFGEAAAILTAAGINVAGTLAAAGMQNKAAKDAAKQQADAIKQQAKQQAAAIAAQDENNKKLQEQSIQLTKEQNEENRDLQKEIQMNLQLLTGQQNQTARNETSKIVVRNGGSLKRRTPYFPLRGDGNMPFRVTDGGGVIPLGKTPEGYDLYEIIGNDHKHYHKSQGGKYKSGVGFKFANGEEVEGEGNQSARKGELLLVTPNDAQFISKHSIEGFNPTDAVLAGMHPSEAFAIQEQIKAENGIMNNGKKRRKLRTIGGIASSPYSLPDVINGPDFSTDTIAPTAAGVAYVMQQNAETNPNNMNYGSKSKYNVAKCGGSVRRKAADGYSSNRYIWTPANTANVIGAGINTLGNIGGALITNIGNNRALRYITAANNEAAALMADAYGRLQGIDMSNIKRSDFAAPHAMAAVQAPIVNTNVQRTLANRSLLRQQRAIDKGSLSAAASQNRQAVAETNYNDIIGQIETQANKERQAIIQGNMERITQTANENANRDVMANREWLGHYLGALEYNADIANQRILGSADARASALTNNAGARANTIQANHAGWSSAITNSANTWGNIATTIGQNIQNERILKLMAERDLLAELERRDELDWELRHPKKALRRKLASMAANPSAYIRSSKASNPYDWSIIPKSPKVRIALDPSQMPIISW